MSRFLLLLDHGRSGCWCLSLPAPWITWDTVDTETSSAAYICPFEHVFEGRLGPWTSFYIFYRSNQEAPFYVCWPSVHRLLLSYVQQSMPWLWCHSSNPGICRETFSCVVLQHVFLRLILCWRSALCRVVFHRWLGHPPCGSSRGGLLDQASWTWQHHRYDTHTSLDPSSLLVVSSASGWSASGMAGCVNVKERWGTDWVSEGGTCCPPGWRTGPLWRGPFLFLAATVLRWAAFDCADMIGSVWTIVASS